MPTSAKDQHTLVADIGGTNTRVALANGPGLETDTIRRYRNKDFAGLETVLRTYLADMGGVDCAGACVALAGPVRGGVGELTNLDWTIDEATLARASSAEKVSILNDLQAQAHALDYLHPDNTPVLMRGSGKVSDATGMVIGVGTGFNAAAVHETPHCRVVPASECGHANLPVRTETELSLAHFVETAHGFPAIEDVLSGRGLERVYAWTCHEAGAPAEARAKSIIEAAHSGTDPMALAAVGHFVRLLGSVAGNLALIHLPFGGIYLAGGVARAVAPFAVEHGFAEAFRDKGRFAGFMQNFSVSVIEDDYAALQGCAVHLASRPG
ncbi:MAG: glucokinase [Brevirhabdus sp.]